MWLGATASVGDSFWVEIRACDQRTGDSFGGDGARIRKSGFKIPDEKFGKGIQKSANQSEDRDAISCSHSSCHGFLKSRTGDFDSKTYNSTAVYQIRPTPKRPPRRIRASRQ